MERAIEAGSLEGDLTPGREAAAQWVRALGLKREDDRHRRAGELGNFGEPLRDPVVGIPTGSGDEDRIGHRPELLHGFVGGRLVPLRAEGVGGT